MTRLLDFTSQTFFRDPAAGIERLRTSGLVVKTRFPIVGTVWITTIAGLTFAISDELGDVGPGAFGLIAGDTRHLSRLQVLVDGQPLMRLGAGLVATVGFARRRRRPA